MRPFIYSHTRPPTPPVGAKTHHGAGVVVHECESKNPHDPESLTSILARTVAEMDGEATTATPILAAEVRSSLKSDFSETVRSSLSSDDSDNASTARNHNQNEDSLAETASDASRDPREQAKSGGMDASPPTPSPASLPPCWCIVITPLPGRWSMPPQYRLRGVLKGLLRTHGFRALAVQAIEGKASEGEKCQGPSRGPTDREGDANSQFAVENAL